MGPKMDGFFQGKILLKIIKMDDFRNTPILGNL